METDDADQDMKSDHSSFAPDAITPRSLGVSPRPEALLEYVSDTGGIGERLTEKKAMVFRGFGLTAETLEPILDLLLPQRLPYVHGNSPRTKVGSNLYTSTEYPAELTISMHNELSYAHKWPARLLFFCDVAAETGGATPVLDGVTWLDSLDAEIRDAYRDGVRYTQNLHGGMGFGRSWQETFETEDRDVVEEFLAGSGATWEWKADDGIRVSQLRPATITHPATGAEVWFNQSDQWHVGALDPDTATALMDMFEVDDLPQSVTFADGEPIPPDYVIQVRDRGLAAAVDVEWRAGDLLLIDNVLVAHGRRPYTGSRRVLVAMSD